MNNNDIPAEAPPPYTKSRETHLSPRSRTISTSVRRSMEDEMRPLPDGWVRQYDANNSHQFFVDTKANPPRSIWHHPYDDDKYLSTLTSEERERLQELQKKQQKANLALDDTDEEPDSPGPSSRRNYSYGHPDAYESPEIRKGNQKQSFGRKMKDKLTGTTHEQRAAQRAIREQEEAEVYEAHRAMRQAMSRAAETGQPQFVAKDRQGYDVYVEPPGYGDQFYGGTRSANYRGVNPYTQGPYANPNARFIRPTNPYAGRPYGGGFGGGMGLPLMGGLAGGLLLGGMLGGF